MTSTTARKRGLRLWAVALWLAVWQGGSLALRAAFPAGGLLLPSPLEAAARLAALLPSPAFWRAVGNSSAHILGGFLLACLLAVPLGALAAGRNWLRELLAPPVAVVKTAPVASFIILALVWLDAPALPLLISGLMVFPTVYLNVQEGVRQTDRQLLEMTRVFRVPWSRRLRGVYLPQVLPYFRSAASLALGLCWKAGAAAEVIGLPAGTIGERLYMAKVYLQTPDLFAWTAVIIALSVGFETLFLRLTDALARRAAFGNAGPSPVTGGTKPPAASVTVRVEGLSKSYGAKPILRDLSFTAAPGVTCVTAPSGTGKTTLLRLLLGLETPDHGMVSGELRWSAVFQEDRLLEDLSAAGNLRFALGQVPPEAPALLDALGLDLADPRPVSAWSGGMKRRLALARALLAPGDALALDEPFTGLDAGNRARCLALIREAGEKKPVLLVTHDPADTAGLPVLRLPVLEGGG